MKSCAFFAHNGRKRYCLPLSLPHPDRRPALRLKHGLGPLHPLGSEIRMSSRALKILLLSALLAVPSAALAVAPDLGSAPSAPATQAQIAALQQALDATQAASSKAQAAAASAQFAGDNAWMSKSSVPCRRSVDCGIPFLSTFYKKMHQLPVECQRGNAMLGSDARPA